MLGPNAVQALTWLIIDSPRGSVLFHAHSKIRGSLEVVPTLC